jgi:hypothetical protein
MTQEEFVTAVSNALGEDYQLRAVPAVGATSEPTTAWGFRVVHIPSGAMRFAACFPRTKMFDDAAKFVAADIMAQFA